METTVAPWGRHTRRAWWLAIALGLFALASAFFTPVTSLIFAFLYGAVAWGLRRRRAGAGLMSAAFSMLVMALVLSYLFDAPPAVRGGLIAIAVLNLVFGALFLLAGLELTHDPARTAPDWPWALVPLSALLFRTCFTPYVMPSASMQNTLLQGDCFVVNTIHTRLGGENKRDEVIVFRYPLDRTMIYTKRIAGIAGDRISLRHKKLFRNGMSLAEPYVLHSSPAEDVYRDNFPTDPNFPLPEPAQQMLAESVSKGELTVPEGKYFVLGDNRDNSADSRYWGFVDGGDIIGRPVLVYASYQSKEGEAQSVLNMRWNRLFKLL